MSYFKNDNLKISNIIIDLEDNLSLISNFNKQLVSINNIDEFNNIKAQLFAQLNNIDDETVIFN